MRVVSLIASSTEILWELGLGDTQVGRSHECDHPPAVAALPVLTRPAIDPAAPSAEIDAQVKALRAEGAPTMYHLDRERLIELAPDVVLTQAHCEVCAVSASDVQRALAGWPGPRPRIAELSPDALADVLEDVRKVARALDAPERGEELVARMRAGFDAVAARVAGRARRTVACLEWLDPLMAAGNWVPELVEVAGGRDLFGRAGEHSPWLTWEALVAADPDVILAMPCGFDLARTRAEAEVLARHPAWAGLRAVREGRVYLLDANRYHTRPGPRLVQSAEILAEVLHPDLAAFGHRGEAWEPWAEAPIP